MKNEDYEIKIKFTKRHKNERKREKQNKNNCTMRKELSGMSRKERMSIIFDLPATFREGEMKLKE